MTTPAHDHDALIQFVTRYSSLLEMHLVAVRDLMASTVEALMESALEMEKASAKTRESAEERLVMGRKESPATTMPTLVTGMQKLVTGLFEEAHEAAQEDRPSALKELDEKLSELAVNAMGALSSEDVMVQRIEHIILAARGLETSLSYLLLDFTKRSTNERLPHLIEDLLAFTYRQYTSEKEKKEFLAVFPEWKQVG